MQADGRKLLLRGQVAQSKKSWIMLRIQGSSISCKDVFDRVVVFDKTEWVCAAVVLPLLESRHTMVGRRRQRET